MGIVSQEAIVQLQALMDPVDEPLNKTFQNVHQGYPAETLVRFLKAREWNVVKAHKMLLECLQWRVQSDIDDILAGLPVFANGVGLSTFDKASVHYYVQSHIQINEYRDRVILPSASKKHGRPVTTCIKVLDMTGLKLSALSQIKLLTIISTIDDLNYPEKTNTYYIVNAPYIFSACWKVVKPLLQERTRKKIQVLPGCGRDELLKIMDFASLPHFCRREGSGSSRHSENENCFSLDHPFHQQLYNYIKQQSLITEPAQPIKQGSFHVDLPDPAAGGTEIAKTLESELHKIENRNGLSRSFNGIKIDDE
ncbi:phosphatidylinositol/phosphatidylcholine transfer protein SFH1-like isoform X3 [Durio zibethinus]|uniref:Phosphatidylinositol/phosphatidylcholine transfer protein SFH1-like isoform X3 n=1 Tax=Durio zibethinus TaxID=66656 RepID=A0A6P5WJF0_DURZI|nr:phosphatidylinositol/phosphatidylcholine transfer protein SFH1-like isoform X3 [Durio zibethinus]